MRMRVCVAWPCVTYSNTTSLLLKSPISIYTIFVSKNIAYTLIQAHTPTHKCTHRLGPTLLIHSSEPSSMWHLELECQAVTMSIVSSFGERQIFYTSVLAKASAPLHPHIFSHTHKHAQPFFILQFFFKGRFNSARDAFCRQLLLPLVFIYMHIVVKCAWNRSNLLIRALNLQ